jgi:hypothetical protein
MRDIYFPALYGFSSPAGTTTPFSSSIFASDPSWCMLMRMSQPPMNSLSTYSCGIVGHSEYSLIPVQTHQLSKIYNSGEHMRIAHPPVALRTPCTRANSRDIPARNSWSSNTLNAVNFSGSTPCMPRICMLALEKPHWGVSGVPFINKTTGADATALSIAVLTWSERNRAWNGVTKRNGAAGRVAGVLARVAARNA